MSLYNMLFGVSDAAPYLMAMLKLKTDQVPRFRDCWLDHEKKLIAVHTRTGGGNRDYYEDEASCRDNCPEYFEGDSPPSGPWNADLRKHELFAYDEDCDYDSTYATFYFRFPEKLSEPLSQICDELKQGGAVCDPGERWRAAMEELKGQLEREPV